MAGDSNTRKCTVKISVFAPAGVGGHLTIREGAAPSFNPLPFYIPFWQKRYPFYVPFIEKRYPFHIPTLEHCTPFLRFCNTLTNNTMGEYQALPEEMLSKRQPFIYLEPEKSTHFGRSLPV